LTSHQKIGEGTGLVGILTEGRLTREDTIRQAIQMALTAFEKANLYQ
jgi:non-canonical (house-cleaning) NTP pyrophosphatase